MRAWSAFLAVALVAIATLAGCGGGSSDSSAADEPDRGQPSATIEFESPAVRTDGVIVPEVRCGQGTFWLPLKWDSLPEGTEGLVLYFGRFERDRDRARGVKVSFAAIATGISPKLRGMAANTIPTGAEYHFYVSFENCPPERKGQRFLLELFAMGYPRGIPTDDAFALRLGEEALGVKQFATESEVATELREEALATGRFVAIYAPVESE